MKTTNIHLLVNSGSRRSRQSRRDIEHALKERDITITATHVLERGQDMQALCKHIIKQSPGLVIIGGGDGTVSSALHYFAGTDIEIGIIPLGTTNNFARSLGLPLTIAEAIDVIVRTKAHGVDMGVVNGRLFANVVGIGLSAKIAQHVTDTTKKRWGRLAYLVVGLQQFIKHRSFVVDIHDKDNEISFNIETRQVIVANGRYHAGKVISHDAALDNRELIIFALGGHGRFSFAYNMIDYYLGRRKKIIHSSYVVGRDVEITTSRQEPAEIDGETGVSTPLSFQVSSQAVKVRHRQ